MSIEHGDSSASVMEVVAVVAGALCGGSGDGPGGSQCAGGGGRVARLVSTLAPAARSQLPPQRCAALAALGELLNYRYTILHCAKVGGEGCLVCLGGGGGSSKLCSMCVNTVGAAREAKSVSGHLKHIIPFVYEHSAGAGTRNPPRSEWPVPAGRKNVYHFAFPARPIRS